MGTTRVLSHATRVHICWYHRISHFVFTAVFIQDTHVVNGYSDQAASKGVRAAAQGKIHSKHHHQHGGGNLYIREMCASVQALDAIQGKHTRIFLLVDGLETTDGEKVLECVETIHSCFNRQMLVNIICTDFHLLSSAANTNFLRPSSNLQLNGNEYLQNTIQLPIFLVDNR